MGKGKQLWRSAIVVEAAVAAVAELLVNVKAGKISEDNAFMLYAGDSTALTLTGGPDVFQAGGGANPGGGGMRIEVDRSRPSFSVQGGWWYRGEHSVEEHPKGALLVYQVFNVAKDFSWMVPMMWKQHKKNMSTVQDTIAKISKRLGVKAYEA